MQIDGQIKDATSYVNGIANISVILLANADKQVVDNLLSQVGDEEKMFIQSALAGIEHRMKEK
ncbi:hypothetical protein [Bacillus sp. AFS019443]|uniref:hypothetical protein n=1 Tax=Bacillus sp. AFS019443 TaxID=2034279 RepID=UPI000BF48686|nr:hypothetical protein [Bacillus sp. AFS019443]PEU16831.1 hypothetical protein CN524_03585 [Bacillus sp. AFS019443]